MSEFSTESSTDSTNCASIIAPATTKPATTTDGIDDEIDDEVRPYCDTLPPPNVPETPATPATPATPSAQAAIPAAIRPAPRQKFRLGPGFGMLDWVRLKTASKDLAQLKGASPTRPITMAELENHNSQFDGWIVLHGAVYNVSPYVPYHPGGAKIFLPVLGKDATKEFDKFHRWVNISGLIGSLKIGVIVP